MSIADTLWHFPSAMMAWRNLGRNRMRTALAALGIVIGVVAIASLGMAGVAIQQQATSNLGSLTNQVSVSAGQDSDYDGVTDDQVEEIRSLLTNAQAIPQKTNSTTVSSRGKEAYVSVTGVTDANALYDVTEGTAPERLQTGALISNSTAQQLGLELGDPVEYDGHLYRIAGLIDSSSGFGPGGGRGELVIPISGLADQQYYDSVTITADDGDAASNIANRLDEHFNSEGHEDEEILRVSSYANVQGQISSFMNTLQLALLGIGGISLIVASVAILNVMLMSTVERRGEIGVLRAVGIRRGEVLRMILTEAALLGTLGGLVGALAALAVGAMMFHVLVGDASAALQWSSARYLVYGFAFAVFASVLSGIYPAWKAANDSPVEALRG
ncbi:cell division protein FtsX [Halarchaeum acidiphilum MH1-52-1]|uniref:Cell division protein FtsX n=1 Tax=Halarchaeum acidiphilum MH1-52-1 TaxID=1261545 RepID=U3A1H9_9EURY|nr:ABC transporter permease [Halarchaeum acidiphilum]GAD51504.1 cell division protein FtsX [Halarchaeum acidiphilum MH1-52-1]